MGMGDAGGERQAHRKAINEAASRRSWPARSIGPCPGLASDSPPHPRNGPVNVPPLQP